MDKPIEKKKGIALAFSKKALPYWFGAMMAAFILWLIFRDDASTLRVNGDTLTFSEVRSGEFNDYIRISGQVHPMTTIQISPREAGIVEEIIAEEGSFVKAGDVIIKLSNDDLDLQILNSEANLAEKENTLRNTMISMEQQKMQLSLDILELQTEVKRKGRALESQRRLFDDGLIGKEEYLRSEEDYTLFCKKLEVTLARAEQDSLYRSVQIKQMRESTLPFLNEPAAFAMGPFLLALIMGVPCYSVFGLRNPTLSLFPKYKMYVERLEIPQQYSRKERTKVLEQITQQFVLKLEKLCLQYPYQWYNFYSFWAKPDLGD